MIVYMPVNFWNEAPIKAFFEKYNGTYVDIPALNVTNGQYYFEEADTNEYFFGTGDIDMIVAFYTIYGATAQDAANYMVALQEAGFKVLNSGNSYSATKAVEGKGLFRLDYSFDPNKNAIGIIFYIYLEPFPTTEFPQDEISEALGGFLVDTVPGYVGETTGFQLNDDTYGLYIVVEVEQGTEDEGKIQCELCFQSLDALPEGFKVPEGRQKPWGTNHAVLMGKDIIKEPFCVINCDDFYGRDAFMQIGKFLSNLSEGSKNEYAMVGFRVCNTLSENGSVARGVCAYNEKRHLTDVVERTEILRMDGVIKYKDEQGDWQPLEENVPVSMNMWGFTPDYFEHSESYFKEFLSDPKNIENLKAEFFIPLMVNKLINDNIATCEVLDTTSKWFGVTYAADRDATVARIKQLVDNGVYPQRLF